MKRSALKRGNGFKPRKSRTSRGEPKRPSLSKRSAKKLREAGEKKRARLKKVGDNSKSKNWPRAWRKLKPEFERAGITRCERCGTDRDLTPAHTLKRRHITNETELNEVVLLCVRCHDHYELQGEAKMCPALRALIAKRQDRLTEAA